MRQDYYPEGTVEKLLETGFVTPQTKQVLQERLEKPVVQKPEFFSLEEFATLQAVCKRLLPQPADRQHKIDIAGIFDSNMKDGKTENGWRYNNLPPDEEACKAGLQVIEQTSQRLYGKAFHEADIHQQDKLLQDMQQNKAEENMRSQLPFDLFFKDLFASLAEIYYSHPIGRNEIGDASFADVTGWNSIQLNQREQREPEVATSNHS